MRNTAVLAGIALIVGAVATFTTGVANARPTDTTIPGTTGWLGDYIAGLDMAPGTYISTVIPGKTCTIQVFRHGSNTPFIDRATEGTLTVTLNENDQIASTDCGSWELMPPPPFGSSAGSSDGASTPNLLFAS